MLENDLERLIQTLGDKKKEQSELNKQCLEKNQKIGNLENKINDLELRSTENNLIMINYTKKKD